MRQFDLTPLYRHSVGFDRLANVFDNLKQFDQGQNSYPPFNIEKLDENSYRITLAVAGFSENDLTIESKDGFLVVTGAKGDEQDEPQEFLHRGIAERSFERRFQLADHVEVLSADLKNGLLHIDLVRELPESKRPRKIAIGSTDANETKTIDSDVKN